MGLFSGLFKKKEMTREEFSKLNEGKSVQQMLDEYTAMVDKECEFNTPTIPYEKIMADYGMHEEIEVDIPLPPLYDPRFITDSNLNGVNDIWEKKFD